MARGDLAGRDICLPLVYWIVYVRNMAAHTCLQSTVVIYFSYFFYSCQSMMDGFKPRAYKNAAEEAAAQVLFAAQTGSGRRRMLCPRRGSECRMVASNLWLVALMVSGYMWCWPRTSCASGEVSVRRVLGDASGRGASVLLLRRRFWSAGGRMKGKNNSRMFSLFLSDG